MSCAGSEILLSSSRHWKTSKAVGALRRNSKFIYFRDMLMMFSRSRSSDPNGTIHLALGPSIKAELKFLI